MPTPRQILSRLSDGRYHSGEALAQEFGVSRTAVWKHLAQLKACGLSIQSSRGKGYRLEAPLECLEALSINEHLTDQSQAKLRAIDIEFIVDSTNVRAQQWLASPEGVRLSANEFALFLAEQQTRGRGRRGREWFSPLGHNIYLSMAYKFDCGIAGLAGLSLVVGVCVAETLAELGFADVELKWPNDLLWRGRKLGGILVEIQGDMEGPCAAVIGIGINRSSDGLVANKVGQPWVALDEIARASGQPGSVNASGVGRNRSVAAIINALVPAFARYEVNGFAAWHDRWGLRDALTGRRVTLSMGAEAVEGRYHGVDSRGTIMIETSDGLQSFAGGEISVRTSDS